MKHDPNNDWRRRAWTIGFFIGALTALTLIHMIVYPVLRNVFHIPLPHGLLF